MFALIVSAVIIFSTLLRATAQVTAVNGVSVLYDPGPRHRCYDFYEEGGQGLSPNPEKGTAECADYQISDRVDTNCAWFGPVVGGNASQPICPLWRFDTYGWYYDPKDGTPSQWGTTPGYSTGLVGGNGSPITVSLTNSARDTGDCTLREVTLSYEYYASSFIKNRKSDGALQTLDLANHLVVSYDVLVERDTSATAQPGSCTNQRRLLTTDFIYWYNDTELGGRKNLLSIAHFNPTNHPLPWTNSSEEGCRLMIQGPSPVAEGVQTHVSLDFKALLAQHSSDLCHAGGVPAGAQFQSIQIVSSNVAANSVVRLSNVDAQYANSTTTGGEADLYGQCGGAQWTGPTSCPAGSSCRVQNEWYSQCLP